MCGFVVGIKPNLELCDIVTELEKGLTSIQHRGPDGQSAFSETLEDGRRIAMGHVRLSIIDTSDNGKQPMSSSCGRYIMVYNGELYNFRELRALLPEVEFQSQTDSEVFLELYVKFGTPIFKKMDGMFAAVIFDRVTSQLTLVRDQIGVKPVYLYFQGTTLAISSEIRGLLPLLPDKLTLDEDAVFEFLNCGFCYEPRTGFREINKLKPGYFAEINGDEIKYHEYFNLNDYNFDRDNVKVHDVIRSQLVSDVKIGNFFSGGTDSTVIAQTAQVDNLFLEYGEQRQDQVNDLSYATEIASKLTQNLQIVKMGTESNSRENIIASMRSTASGLEELISDFTFISSKALSEKASGLGYKVMLSGMGGDEVFAGYPRYSVLASRLLYSLSQVTKLTTVTEIFAKFPRFAKKIRRLAGYHQEHEFPLKYARLLGYFSNYELKSFLGSEKYDRLASRFVERQNIILGPVKSESLLTKALYLDFYGFLSHNLLVADKSSMSESLEVRVPLLNSRLYAKNFQDGKIKKTAKIIGKKKLKTLLLEHLPKKLVFRKKTGFNAPLDGMIAKLGEKLILSELENGSIYNHIDANSVYIVIKNHFLGIENNTYKIWQLLFFNYWLEANVSLLKKCK